MKTSDPSYINTALGTGQYPQIGSLISITNHSHQFTLVNSKFTDNSVVKGAVYLEFKEAAWKNYAQTIMNNVFENNAGIFANVALFVRAWTSTSNYQTLPTQDQQCTGFSISYNQFKNNFGCPQYGGSIFQFECLSTQKANSSDVSDMDLILLNDNSTIREASYDPYTVSDIKKQLRDSVHDFQDYEPNYLDVYSFDNITTYQVDQTSTTMNHNTFDSNFASYNKGIMDISGIKLLNIYNTTFTNNGESTYEVLKHLQNESAKQLITLALSQNNEYTKALIPASGIDYQHMISLINIQHCSQLLLNTVTFDSNWIGSSNMSTISISSSDSSQQNNNSTSTNQQKYRAQLLMLNNFYGSLEIQNCQINNQVGLLNAFAYQFYSAFETTYTQGGSVLPLISFQVGQSQVKEIIIESTNFSNIYFSNDIIYDSSFFQYTINQNNNYPLDKFKLSHCKFENISCQNCLRKQFFVVNTYDLELSYINISNINYIYSSTQYPSYFMLNLFSDGQTEMTNITLGQNISVTNLRGGFGGIYNLQQSVYSANAINSNFILKGGVLYGSYSKSLQNQLIGFLNITNSSFLMVESGQKGMAFYVNQKHSILVNYGLNNGRCRALAFLEEMIAGQDSVDDAGIEDSLEDATSGFMKPLKDSNQYELGTFMALYSQEKVIYTAKQNAFIACVQAYYGAVMDVRSAYSSITDYASQYIFSAAVEGSNFFCVNCYVFDIEKPTITFAYGFQGGIAYLDYDDTYSSAPQYQNDTNPIKLNFQSYYLEGVIGWYNGGFVKINGKTKKFEILMKDSQLGSIVSGQEQFYEDSEYGGGTIFHIKAKYINITLVNTTIYSINAGEYGYGAVLYLSSLTDIVVNISNSILQDLDSIQNGIVIYGKAVNKINVTLEHSFFDSRAENVNVTEIISLARESLSDSINRGTGFYLNSLNTSQVFINSTNNTYTKFIGAGSAEIGGGVFRLQANSTFIDNGSQFLLNAAGEGGNIFCQKCNIEMYNSNIQNAIASRGAFIYVDEDQINLKMKNVTVNYTMTNDAGGLLYFMQDIQNRFAGNLSFENVNFSNTGSYFGGGLIALNCENCNVNFTSCNFAHSGVGGMDSGKGTANDGGFFHVTGVKSFLIKDSTFTDLEVKKLVELFEQVSGINKDIEYYQANFGTQILFAEITGSSIFTFDNITIMHYNDSNFDTFFSKLQSLNANLRSVKNTYQFLIKVNCEGSISCKVISKNSIYKNNQLGKAGSIFNLKSVDFYDSNSKYAFNVAVTGGTISAQNSNLTITSNYYNYNFAFSGGVLQIIDQCNVYVSKTSFIFNGAKYKGGIFDVVLANSASNDQTTIKVTDCLFQDNFGNYSGGIIQLENENVRLIAYNNIFKANFVYQLNGGTFSILNAYYIDIRNNKFTEVGGSGSGTLLFAQSLGIENITLINNTVQCSDTYNQSEVTNVIMNDTKYLYENTIYIGEVQKVLSKYNTFTQCVYNNEGGVFYLDKTNFTDIGSEFTYNSAFYGGVIKCSQCNLDLTDSIFENNIAYDGGVILLDNSATMTAEYIKMNYNIVINQAGCILARTNSYFIIFNSQFSQNIANVSSSVVQALGTSNTEFLVFKYCKFTKNNAEQNTFSIQYSKLKIIGCQFLDNQANAQSKNLFLGFSTVIIQGTIFKYNLQLQRLVKVIGSDGNPSFEYQQYLVDQFSLVEQDKTTGSFILCILQVSLTIQNSQFVNGYSSVGGAIFISGDSTIIISATKFTSNFANQYGGSIYGTGFTLLQIDKDSEFTDGYANFQGDDIFVRNSENITLVGVKFKSKYFQNSLYFETINSLLQSVEIQDNFNQTTPSDGGGGLYCLDCFSLIIKSSLFKNLKSQAGGCIYLLQTSNSRDSSVYQIKDSTFQNCTALTGQGGALSLMNIENLAISNTKFLGSSSPKEGGAIYFQCDDYMSDTSCILKALEGVQFINNSAGISGGAIFWNDIEPLFNISNLKFSNNKALIYGDNVGSFAQRITTITFQQIMNSRGQYGFRRYLESTDVQITSSQQSIQNQTLDSYRSGAIIPTFYMGLVDKYGQIVKTDSSSKIQVRIDSEYNIKEIGSLKYPPIITGTSQFLSQNGTFEIVNLQFTGTPGQNYKIQLFTDGIDMTKPSNKLYLQQLQTQSNDITFDLKMELRECQIGEQFADSGQCNLCSNRTEYSLIKQNSPGTCKSCPTDKAVCLGGSDIGPKPFYWRKNNHTDNFIQCLRAQSCLGMVYPEKNPMGSCQYGYRGVLCADCISGYSRESEFSCSKCPDKFWNAARLLLTFIGAGLALALLIRSTLKGATARKNVISIYTKIVMNHLSLLAIATSFNFSWPDKLNEFFSSFKPVSQATQQILSFDCLVADTANITSNSPSGGFAIVRTVYIKMTLMAVLPFILAILCFSVWWIISRKKKDASLLRTKAISSIVIVLFFVYSSIVQSMLDMFNCIDVDGESRLKIDLEVVCYKGQHSFWSLFVAVPGILVWGVGIPMLSYMLINKEKHRLDSIDIKAKYGFLYRGYKRKYFYYESIVMYRKTIIIFVSVFMVSFGVIVQALVIFILLIAGLSKQLILKPYQTYALNYLELLSIFASGITIYIGIFFIINSASSTDNQSSFQFSGLDNNSKMFFLVIIIFSNINFFAIWTMYFLIEIKEYMIKKLPWLYLNVFLCGDRQKLKLHQYEADVREENEVLREEYMNSLKVLREAYDKGQIILNKTVLERFKVYLNLERVYDNIGLRKQFLENDHTVLRKQRLKSDKHNLEALNSSESMKDENHFKLLKKYENVNKMETLIDNIDFDFDDRTRSLNNSSNSGQYNFGSSFVQKDSQFLKLGKSLTKFEILIDKLSETKHGTGPQSSKNKQFDNDELNHQTSSQSDQKPSTSSKGGPILDAIDEFQEDQVEFSSQRGLLQDKTRQLSQANDSPIKLNINNDQYLKPTKTKDTRDKRKQLKPSNHKRRKSQMKEKQLMASINRLIDIDEFGDDRSDANNEKMFEKEFQQMIEYKQQEEQQNEEKDQLHFVKGSKRKMNIQELKRRREIMESLKSGIKNKYKRIRKDLKHQNNLSQQKVQELQKEMTQLKPQLTMLQGEISDEVILKNLKKKRTLHRNNFISGNSVDLQEVDYEINQYVQESARDLLEVKDIHNTLDTAKSSIKLNNFGVKGNEGFQAQLQGREVQSKSANILKNQAIDGHSKQKLDNQQQQQRMKGLSQQFKKNIKDRDQVNIGFDNLNDGDVVFDQDSSLIITFNEDESERMKLRSSQNNKVNQDFIQNNKYDTSYAQSLRNYPTEKSQNIVRIYIDKDKQQVQQPANQLPEDLNESDDDKSLIKSQKQKAVNRYKNSSEESQKQLIQQNNNENTYLTKNQDFKF
eukprot:403333206